MDEPSTALTGEASRAMSELSTGRMSQRALLELAEPRDRLSVSVLMPGQPAGGAGQGRIRRENLLRAARRAMRDLGVDVARRAALLHRIRVGAAEVGVGGRAGQGFALF